MPVGTTVGAYPRSRWGVVLEGAPSGSAVESHAIASDGTLTYTALTDGTEYVATAIVSSVRRFLRFMPAPLTLERPVFVGGYADGEVPVWSDADQRFEPGAGGGGGKRKLWYPTGLGTAGSGDTVDPAKIIDINDDRFVLTTTQALTNSQLRCTGNLMAPAGVPVAGVLIFVAGGATTPAHTFAALADQALNVVGKSADALTTAMAGASWRKFDLTTPWTPSVDTAVYACISSTAATPLSVSIGPGTINALPAQAPKLGFNVAGTIDDPTDVGATIAINAAANMFWAAIYTT